MSKPNADDCYRLFLEHFAENPPLRKRLEKATRKVNDDMIHVELNGLCSLRYPAATAVDFLREETDCPTRMRFSNRKLFLFEFEFVSSWADAANALMFNFPITAVFVSEDERVPIGAGGY
jgi:hypothetical protein